MLTFSNLMVGSADASKLGEFYTKVLNREPDMKFETTYGWMFGDMWFTVSQHSEVHGQTQEPARMLINFTIEDVQAEFERVKAFATVIKAPYQMPEMGNGWISTLADPDGNYFQLTTPWESDK